MSLKGRIRRLLYALDNLGNLEELRVAYISHVALISASWMYRNVIEDRYGLKQSGDYAFSMAKEAVKRMEEAYAPHMERIDEARKSKDPGVWQPIWKLVDTAAIFRECWNEHTHIHRAPL